MTRKFINRERELKVLEKKCREEGFRFVVVYGRRRVGKTRLIKKFIENKKHIYFLCSKRKLQYNLKKFSEKICSFISLPKLTFENFVDAFRAIAREDVIVVIDEFGYLLEKDEGLLSDFQEIMDEMLINSNVKVILTGSSVSMIESRVLGCKSPLYGRTHAQLKVKPFSFEEIFKWFKKIGFEDAVKIYAVTNNIPKYMEFFEGNDIENEIIKNFFDDSSFLYNDAIILLSEELRDYTTYFQVLEAIALGYNKITEIANYSYLNPKDVYFYLKVLSTLEIVEREVPLLAKRKEKKGIYRIKDNYFNFWFKFVSPFQSEIESYTAEIATKNFEKNFNSYLGFIFEKVVMDLLRRKLNIFPFTKIGKQWGKKKSYEIDILALNEQTKETLFCECKWQKKVNAKKVCKELLEKAQYVNWNNEKRKESFAIFAKSFSKKISEFEGKKVYCFDLKGLESLI